MAGLITHIQFEGEFQSLTFALQGILLVKGELMKVMVEFDFNPRETVDFES
jgi:hypothetical protein